MAEEVCRNCLHYQPHVFFPYIGYCSTNERSVHENETCGRFKRVSLDELLSALDTRGGVYCVTCGATIVDRDQLESHPKAHRVVTGMVIDEAIAEEAKAAD